VTLACISIFLFTKTHPEKTLKARKPLEHLSLLVITRTIPGEPLSPRKKWRNFIYRFCGYTIIFCIILLGIQSIPSIHDSVEHLHPMFWLESIAVVAFGVSWLIKGETLLKDRKSDRESELPAQAQVRT
jgi:hypothetical protein